MRIIVSVFNNLATDQRVEKTCKTLVENGYEVELIGNSWGGLPEMERPYKFKRFALKSKILKFAYLEYNWILFNYLKKQNPKNTLFWCNDLDILTANFYASKRTDIPLIYDSHEIFTEMPSVQGRLSQKIWRCLEKKFIYNIKYVLAASNSYANWFAEHYKIEKPIVLQNFPRRIDYKENTEIHHTPNVILYQGAINPSRGLDKIIPAMKHIQNAELWIAGKGPKLEEYQKLSKNLHLESKVKFLGNLPPEKLRTITEKADVGLSIEENNGLSYFYSLPNKVSDYIQAGVPVVTSPFPEMKAIIDQYKVGETIEDHSEKALVKTISSVLSRGKSFYQNNLSIAANELCWENEEEKILNLLKRVISENFLFNS